MDDPLIGRTIDSRYRVEQRLGAGAMGVVYRVTHVELGQPLALKLLHPQLSRDERLVERFRREARAASSIGHPNIASVRDFGTLADGSVYLVMELLAGRSLRDLLDDEAPLYPARVVHMAEQICAALDAAHAHGVIHRDLKPDNVLVNDDAIKVVDFGIAKLIDAEKSLTGTGELVGTPVYMSPEQCRGVGVDARSDVYALGVMLFEMLAGRLPFTGDSPIAMITAHLTEEAPRIRSAAPEVPESLEEVIACCLSKDKDARPATMRELSRALGLAWRRASEEIASADTFMSSGSQRPVVVEARAVAGRRGTRTWAIVGLVLVSCAAAVAVWAATRRIAPEQVRERAPAAPVRVEPVRVEVRAPEVPAPASPPVEVAEPPAPPRNVRVRLPAGRVEVAPIEEPPSHERNRDIRDPWGRE